MSGGGFIAAPQIGVIFMDNNINNFQDKIFWMTIGRQILENQEIILLALSKLVLPRAVNHEGTVLVNTLIDKYHKTRKLLGKSYLKRGDNTDPYEY